MPKLESGEHSTTTSDEPSDEHSLLEDLPQRYEAQYALNRLEEHPRNVNRGDLAAIEESMDENGWYGAIVVQESTNLIIAGNHRYRLRKLKGKKTGPVIFVDCDDETALRIMLADNETTRRGHVDGVALEALLADLAELPKGLKGTGYDLEALSDVVDAEEAEEGQEEAFDTNWGVIVRCDSEKDQEAAYNRLTEMGYEVRVVAV